MKPIHKLILIHLFAFLLLLSCSTVDFVPKKTEPSKKIVLAWGEKHQDWTDHLMKETQVFKTAPKDICTKTAQKDLPELYAQLISMMAKFESGWDPNEKYSEAFVDSKGNPITSRGLLQISIESSNQSAYKCGTKDPNQLHDPFFNLSCGVKIMSYWTKDEVLFGSAEKNTGCGRYWSVCRPIKAGKPRESYSKISAYVKTLPICLN